MLKKQSTQRNYLPTSKWQNRLQKFPYLDMVNNKKKNKELESGTTADFESSTHLIKLITQQPYDQKQTQNGDTNATPLSSHGKHKSFQTTLEKIFL